MNEQRISDALHALAVAGDPSDEALAWENISEAIGRDRARSRRRAVLVLSGLAAAGAAAAGVLVLAGDGDDREAVEIGPADSTTVPLSGFPERPLAVVVEVDGADRLDLYDADTGEPVTLGLASSNHSISDVSITTDGTVYFTEEFGDSTTVRSVPWDGSADPTTPFDADEIDSSSPTLSPDHRRFAYIHQGPATPESSIVLIDTRTGDRRDLPGPADVQLSSLEFSPGGDWLLVVVDGTPMVLDVDATSVSEAEPLPGAVSVAGAAVFDAHWSASDEVIALVTCCAPDFTDPATFQAATLDNPGTVEVPDASGVAAFDVDRLGSYAAVRDDGTVALLGAFGASEEFPLDGARAVDVGF